MTEELKVTNDEQKNDNKCFCQSKSFKKFVVTALGTFVGVYFALCLFAALHRPPMMPPCAGFRGYNPPPAVFMHHPCKHKHHFNKDFRQDNVNFDKKDKIQKGNPIPFNKEFSDD